MSAEAETAPALSEPKSKSEDKLEIEKEEKEKVDKGESGDENKKEVENGDEEKKDEEKEDKEKTDQTKSETDEKSENDSEEKKKFKIQVPGFLRSKSKDRKKSKDEDETKKDGEASDKKESEKESSDKEEKDKKEDDKKDGNEAKEKKDEEKPELSEDNKEDGSKISSKMPKFSKPKFFKKKSNEQSEKDKKEESSSDKESKHDSDKEKETKKDEGGKESEDNKEEKDNKDLEEGNGGESKKEEKQEEEAAKDENDHSKAAGGFFDSLKNMITRKSSKGNDLEAGNSKNEEKEKLLDDKGDEEKKEEEKENEERKQTEDKGDEEKKNDEDDEKKDEEKANPEEGKGGGFLSGLRSVASHASSIFSRRHSDKVVDVEGQETRELLEDTKKDDAKEGDDLEEVKVEKGDKNEEEGKESSQKKDNDKKDAKKSVQSGMGQYLCALDESTHRKWALFIVGLLVVVIFAIVLAVALSTPAQIANHARITDNRQFIETHTMCGPVQGLVDGPDQFSFYGIPYAAPLSSSNRFEHSKPIRNLDNCYEGTFLAHSANSNESQESHCWRRLPSGSASGIEDCLTLDIFTSNVVYNELMPVVVFIDGDGEVNEDLQPNSALAQKNEVVFVHVRYRLEVMGFLSLNSISRRAYPRTSGNFGLGDIISALRWIKINIQHFGGHPKQITLLGRGFGATMVTAITAAPKARGLFQRVWATNGIGIYETVSLRRANTENKEILNNLNCGPDEISCLSNADAASLTLSTPNDWFEGKVPDLPMMGEEPEVKHSWLVLDKYILFQTPEKYWKNHRLTNNVPMVFGATAQGDVTSYNFQSLDWNNTNTFRSNVENRLVSYNTSLANQAIDLYNKTGNESNWSMFASMVTDVRTVCPLQTLAVTASNNFVSKVYSYVATAKRQTIDRGRLSDEDIDVAAIFEALDDDQVDSVFARSMRKMFYTFVKEGKLPQDKDLTVGMYIVGENGITTQRSYPTCDFWNKQPAILPAFASRH